ncbi:integrase arm-type DNA-binding domain-containing protein [Variovorax sp. dw_308]|uniref:tyrosine-type recombinase/integrase n=1 Tax=Variovorax sp. dw_308 TaxID=2721546 RepID=UPI001C47BCA1|nr:integrase arm-type DNA-binding domain-containing protein [Variovorax sp. dw_308]
MKLTDAKLRNLNTTGKHADGRGLYLEVTAAGGRYWRQKYRFAGKEKRLALGVYPDVSLKDARDKCAIAKQALDRGEDPGALRKAAKVQAAHESANSLEIVTRDWLAHQSGRWDPVTLARATASLEADIFPTLGSLPMASITARDVMNAVKKIEKRGSSEVAVRVLQRIKSTFRYAVTHGRIDHNPMLDLVPSEILKPRRVQHRPALADRELPTFFKKLAEYEGDPHTLHALRLLMLTAVRPGEVRGARWSEFDLDAALWRIPAERMKMRSEHLVPLSVQAIDVLKAMQPLSSDRDLVFPSPFYPSKSLSENTINSALARMGYKGTATAHGFRSLFSTVANEAGWSPDVIERQLAHVERNQVRAAYNRSTYLQDREKLMQWWADYLDGRKVGKVIALRKRMN